MALQWYGELFYHAVMTLFSLWHWEVLTACEEHFDPLDANELISVVAIFYSVVHLALASPPYHSLILSLGPCFLLLTTYYSNMVPRLQISCDVMVTWRGAHDPAGVQVEWRLNSLTTNDAYMRHDPCELSISLWEFIWSIKYKALYFSTGILLILAVSYGTTRTFTEVYGRMCSDSTPSLVYGLTWRSQL